MQNQFDATRTSRDLYGRYFDNFTLEQLNKIPAGFNNNLIWNIGHVVISQQTLVYKGSNQTPMVSDELIARYFMGTKPVRDATRAEADEIKNLLFATIDKTEEDYRNGLFTAYNTRKTLLGFMLNTVDDAIVFNNYHEGIHLGIMMQLRKFI